MQEHAAEDPFDLLVVGAGAAGSVIAAQAARRGKRVLILEAGPARQLSDLTSSQFWARRLKWSGAEVEEDGQRKLIGVGRLVADMNHDAAEYAVIVVDRWHGHGLGSLLTGYCVEVAENWGVKRSSPKPRK